MKQTRYIATVVLPKGGGLVSIQIMLEHAEHAKAAAIAAASGYLTAHYSELTQVLVDAASAAGDRHQLEDLNARHCSAITAGVDARRREIEEARAARAARRSA